MILEDYESILQSQSAGLATPPADKEEGAEKPPTEEPPRLQASSAAGFSLQPLPPGATGIDETIAGAETGGHLAQSIDLSDLKPSNHGHPHLQDHRQSAHRERHHHHHQHREHHRELDHHGGDSLSARREHREHQREHHHHHHHHPGDYPPDAQEHHRQHHARMAMWMKRDDVREELQPLKESIGEEIKQLRSLIKQDLQEVLTQCIANTLDAVSAPPRRSTQRSATIGAVDAAQRFSAGGSESGKLLKRTFSAGSTATDQFDGEKGMVRMDSDASARSMSLGIVSAGMENWRRASHTGAVNLPAPRRQTVRRSEKPSTIPEASSGLEIDIGVVPMRRFVPGKDVQDDNHDFGQRGDELLNVKASQAGVLARQALATTAGMLRRGSTLGANQISVAAGQVSRASTEGFFENDAKPRNRSGSKDKSHRPSILSLTGRAQTMPLKAEKVEASKMTCPIPEATEKFSSENGCTKPPEKSVSVIINTDESDSTSTTAIEDKQDAKLKVKLEDQSKRPKQQITLDPRKCSFKIARAIILMLIEDSIFDYVISSCIMLNAVFIGAQSDFQIRNLESDVPQIYEVVERVFCVVFTCELAVRLYAYRLVFFYNSEWKWNWFDFVIVMLQLVEEMVAVFETDAGSKVDSMSDNVNFIRVLRILRLVRVLRLVRLLRFVSELRAMVCSILGSFRSLCWTIVLLMLMIYVASVYLIQLIVDLGQNRPDTYAQEEKFEEFFGSIPRAVLTLFQAMTGGVDWNDLVVPLMEHISPLMALVFSLYIAFAVLAMMNVITGVFVESALLTAKEDKEAELVVRVRRLFTQADEDNSGTISWQEFVARCSDPEMVKYFKALDIDVSEARGLYMLLDTDGSGEVSAEEFVMGCVRLRGPAKAIDLATMMYFNKRMSMKWRAHMSWIEDELEEMYDLLEDTSSWMWAALNQDGQVEVLTGESGAKSDTDPESTDDEPGSPGVIRSTSFKQKRGSAASLHGNSRESAHARRRSRIDDKDDQMYATWADLKAEGRRKASLDMTGALSGSNEKEAADGSKTLDAHEVPWSCENSRNSARSTRSSALRRVESQASQKRHG